MIQENAYIREVIEKKRKQSSLSQELGNLEEPIKPKPNLRDRAKISVRAMKNKKAHKKLVNSLVSKLVVRSRGFDSLVTRNASYPLERMDS